MPAVLGVGLTACHASENNAEINSPSRVAEVLEIIGSFEGDDGLEVSLINLKHDKRYYTVINADNASHSVLDDFNHLKVGDRVKITGDYQENYPVGMANISDITKVANPDKEACESISGQVWRPEGKAQTPTCVTTYQDAGRPCKSSDECDGSCIVHDTIETATCSSSNSIFGCGATIEAFTENGLIMCVD